MKPCNGQTGWPFSPQSNFFGPSAEAPAGPDASGAWLCAAAPAAAGLAAALGLAATPACAEAAAGAAGSGTAVAAAGATAGESLGGATDVAGSATAGCATPEFATAGAGVVPAAFSGAFEQAARMTKASAVEKNRPATLCRPIRCVGWRFASIRNRQTSARTK